MIKKILYISMWVVLVSGLFVLLGFANKSVNKVICTVLNVSVEQDGENFFVDGDDVRNTLLSKGDTLLGSAVGKINVYKIEHALNSHAAIANAEVSVEINGNVNVSVKQRKPVARLFTLTGESYYMDEEGLLMPLSDKYTAAVPIFTGNINEPFAAMYKININDIISSVELKNKTLLDDIFILAKYIKTDDFWSAQLPQIEVTADKDFVFIPRVGDHRIVFGDISEMEEKFNKLKTFYKEGLNYTGGWNAYSSINLKFKNQIVCTKKVISESNE